MLYMNDSDLAQAERRFRPDVVPNRAQLVTVVENLRRWTDSHSDGWAYWPKPCRAAATAMRYIDSCAYPEYDRMQREDISDADLKAALRPIKAFLTRQGVAYSEIGL